jgi:predicted DNA-binding transcriptional regulator YafY
MSRSQRLFALLQALRRRRRPVPARELADELAVSIRTIYRDIETLVRQGAPIEGEAGLGYLLRPGFVLPPLMFSDEELEALVLGARWVAQLPDVGLALAAHDVVAKVTAVLPLRLRTRVEEASLYAVQADTTVVDAIDTGILRSAIRDERKLRISYRDADGHETSRVVWPLALAFFQQVRTIVAWCELRQAFRHFRTDRIMTASLTDDPLPRTRVALLAEWRALEGIAEGPF